MGVPEVLIAVAVAVVAWLVWSRRRAPADAQRAEVPPQRAPALPPPVPAPQPVSAPPPPPVQPPAVQPEPVPEPPPPPPPPAKPAPDQADGVRRIVEAWSDPAALKTLAGELLERADPRGELLTLQLQREPGAAPAPRELELITANQAQWVPPGTKWKAFERAVPVRVEWESTTKPDHPGWLTVEEIVCTADPTTPGSPLDGQVPRLKHLHSMRSAISDPHWRRLYKRIERLHFAELDEALLKRLATTLPRFERLERLAFTECHVALQDLAAALVRASPPKLLRVELPAWGFGPRDLEAAVQALGGRNVPWTLGLLVGSGGVSIQIGHGGATLETKGTPDRGDLARAKELLGGKN